MNEIKIFNNPQFGEIRTATTETGEPLFCAIDITNALGYKNGRKAIADNCSTKGVTTSDTLTKGGVQLLTYINESNLYRLILKSKKTEAEQFETWVCEDILPAIRKTGGYIHTTEADTPELIMARALIVAQEAIEKHKSKLKVVEAEKELYKAITEHQSDELKKSAPKVEFYETVLQSTSTHLTNTIAKELGMSAVTLNRKLHALGVIYLQDGTWVLYHQHQGKGYTKTKTYPFIDRNGKQQSCIQTVWTEAGRQFIHNVLEPKLQTA